MERLSRDFRRYNSQYAVFAESRRLSDQSIVRFLDTAEAIPAHSRSAVPFRRSRVVPAGNRHMANSRSSAHHRVMDKADAAFSSIVTAFAPVKSGRELFDASRTGLKTLFGGSIPAGANQRMLDLLAGAERSDDAETRDAMEQDFVRILDAQHIIPLDTLLDLATQLESGKPVAAQTNKLAARISETPIPRPPLTS